MLKLLENVVKSIAGGQIIKPKTLILIDNMEFQDKKKGLNSENEGQRVSNREIIIICISNSLMYMKTRNSNSQTISNN